MLTPSPQGLAALDERSLSPRQRYAALLVAFGEFIDGYDLLVMGAAVLFLRPVFHLSDREVGALGASTFLGAMIGLLVFGDLSDRLGRRAIFVINLVFFVIFALASAFIELTAQLFVMRFLIGVGVGMDIPTSTAYLAEIAPKKRRGAVMGSLLNVMWILGAMSSTLLAIPLAHLLGNGAWRWMFALAAIPALLVLIARRALPESPRWLLARGRKEEARAAFTVFGIEASDEMLSAAVAQPQGSYGELFRAPHLKRLLACTGVFVCAGFAGSVTTIGTPLVMSFVGAMTMTSTLLVSASVWLVELMGISLNAFLIDRIGRRQLAYLAGIPQVGCALLLYLFAQKSTVALIAGFYGLSFFNWMGIAVLNWVWGSELFPTHLRGRSQGFANASCRLAIAANIYLVPLALSGIGFSAYIGLLAIPMLMNLVIVALNPSFDSGGQSLEQLAG